MMPWKSIEMFEEVQKELPGYADTAIANIVLSQCVIELIQQIRLTNAVLNARLEAK